MAAVVTKSKFWDRAGPAVVAVVDAARLEKPKLGFIDPPGGIKGGVAQVTFCGFGENENGEYYRFVAEIVVPKVHNELPTVGMTVSKTAILRDTDRDAGIKGIVEVLQLCGVEIPPGAQFDPAMIGAAVTNANPPIYIRFSTEFVKGGKPNPKKPGEVYSDNVFTRFHGAVPYSPLGTVPAPSANGSSNGHATTTNPAPWSEATKPVPTGTVTPRTTAPDTFPLNDAATGGYSDTENLDSLGARASSEPEIGDKLRALAKGVGYSDAEIDDSDSWTTVVEWIKGGGKKAEPNADEKPRVPVKGETVNYCPPDKKDPTGQGKLKPVVCEVTDVRPKKGTVDLVRFDDRSKKYLAVPFWELKYEVTE